MFHIMISWWWRWLWRFEYGWDWFRPKKNEIPCKWEWILKSFWLCKIVDSAVIEECEYSFGINCMFTKHFWHAARAFRWWHVYAYTYCAHSSAASELKKKKNNNSNFGQKHFFLLQWQQQKSWHHFIFILLINMHIANNYFLNISYTHTQTMRFNMINTRNFKLVTLLLLRTTKTRETSLKHYQCNFGMNQPKGNSTKNCNTNNINNNKKNETNLYVQTRKMLKREWI